MASFKNEVFWKVARANVVDYGNYSWVEIAARVTYVVLEDDLTQKGVLYAKNFGLYGRIGRSGI